MSIADTRRLLREAAGDCCRASIWLDATKKQDVSTPLRALRSTGAAENE